MSDLSAFLPQSFGKKKNRNSEKKKAVPEKSKDDLLQNFLPSSFGKKRKSQIIQSSPSKKQKIDNEEDQFEEKVSKTTIVTKKQVQQDNFQAPIIKNISNDTVEKEMYPLPISDCVIMKGHQGAVISMDIDPSGSRLITGSTDYNVKFWDFAGMMSDFRSFREVQIEEGHPVVDLAWSDTGSHFLTSTAGLNTRLYNRDGKMISEYVKGDQYIADMQHTKGHVASICNVSWDANDSLKFVTASADSTVRIWDSNRTDKQLEIIKAKNINNIKVKIQTMTTSPIDCKKNIIAAGCLDGSIQVWSMTGNHRQPSSIIRKAHLPNTETSSISISRDGYHMMSRGGDDTLKYWDLRNIQKPLASFSNLENAFQQTSCIFSPDENIMVTGTSTRPGHGVGKVKFYDLQGSIEEIHEINVCDNSVVSLLWHPKLNQLMVGSADNLVRTYYSPNLSESGVLLGLQRNPMKKKVQGFVSEEDSVNIYNPNAIFRPSASTRRQKIKARKDPIKSRKPDLPIVTGTKGHKGQLGTPLSQHIVQNMILTDDKQVQDPREALLKYADAAEANPVFFGDAYKKTQPNIIYSEEIDESDEPKIKKLD